MLTYTLPVFFFEARPLCVHFILVLFFVVALLCCCVRTPWQRGAIELMQLIVAQAMFPDDPNQLAVEVSEQGNDRAS